MSLDPRHPALEHEGEALVARGFLHEARDHRLDSRSVRELRFDAADGRDRVRAPGHRAVLMSAQAVRDRAAVLVVRVLAVLKRLRRGRELRVRLEARAGRHLLCLMRSVCVSNLF